MAMVSHASDSHLTPEQQKSADGAIEWVKENKGELIERFAGDAFSSSETPVSFFMAGSPGAGKTEVSKALAKTSAEKGKGGPLVRIDGDEVRGMLPEYTGGNASIFQGAISLGVNKLHDYALKKKKSFILDGTFAHQEQAVNNVERSLSRGRRVVVIYVYQDPEVSWEFTKKREAKEGRNVPKEAFINLLFSAHETVRAIKGTFGERVTVLLIHKNLKEKIPLIITKNTDIDRHVQIPYSKEELRDRLV